MCLKAQINITLKIYTYILLNIPLSKHQIEIYFNIRTQPLLHNRDMVATLLCYKNVTLVYYIIVIYIIIYQVKITTMLQ